MNVHKDTNLIICIICRGTGHYHNDACVACSGSGHFMLTKEPHDTQTVSPPTDTIPPAVAPPRKVKHPRHHLLDCEQYRTAAAAS